MDLLAHEARQTIALAHMQRFHQMPARVIRAAHVADLAVAYQHVERFERLFKRREPVPFVDLVEVYYIRPEAPQARLAGLDQMMPRQPSIIRPVSHRKTRLGRDQDSAFTLAVERRADDLLRCTVRIDVRRIDQIDARIDAHVDLPARLIEAHFADARKFSLAAHCHCAERDGRHLEA